MSTSGSRHGRPWRPYGIVDPSELGRPRSDLLQAAARSLAAREGVPADAIRWWRGEPVSRPHSTLVPLVAALPCGRRVEAWQKVIYVPQGAEGPDHQWAEHERAGIARGRAATEALRRVDAEAGAPLRLPEILASDPSQLTVVMTSVPGRPLGRLLPWRLSDWWAWWKRYAAVGRAVAALEDLLPSAPPTIEATSAERRLAGALDLAKRKALPPSAIVPVEDRLAQLWRRLVDESTPAVYAHGDLSRSNVLLDGTCPVGLIDIGWKPRLRAFDLSTFSVRLDLEAPRIGWLARRANDALETGYGPLPAGFHLERSQRLLRLLGEGVLDRRPALRRSILRELMEADVPAQEGTSRAARR